MGGVVSGALGLVGGLLGRGAAKDAAAAQAAPINAALDFQRNVYSQGSSNLSPFISTGTAALGPLAQLFGLTLPGGTGPSGNAMTAYRAYTQTPFYQFPLQQGIEAMNRSGAARGLSLSGGQLEAVNQYGQNYASQNFGNYINQLYQLAGMGQGAAGTLLGAGNSAANGILQGGVASGAAQASGITGSQNQLNSALGSIPLALGLSPAQTSTGSSYGVLGNIYNGLFGGPSSLSAAYNPEAGGAMPAGGLT